MGLRDRFGYWWSQLNRRRAKEELSEEIRLHLEMEIQAQLDRGLPPAEARRRALRRFGNQERYKEQCYETSGMARLDGWLRDASYALRMLRKRPLFTLLTTVILALGIGSATAVFSVVHGVLLKPLPFHEPSQLVMISAAHDERGWDGFPIPHGALDAFRRQSRTLPEIAAFQPGSYTWVGGPEPLRLRGAEVTPDLLAVLGVEPLVGRPLDSATEPSDGVLISHGIWRRHFGGEPSVLGMKMRLEGELRTIVGVMPPGFSYPDQETQLWLPLPPDSGDNLWGRWSLRSVARIAPDASLESAREEVSALTEGFAENLPFGGGWRFTLTRLEDELLGEVRFGLWTLLGAVCLVLLIASLNVAAICLARTRDRRIELSMRSVLGAGRWILVRQLLVEHLLLALLGGLGGVVLAHALLGAILALSPPDLPRLEGISIDGSVLLYALLVTVLSGVLAGGLPAFGLTRYSGPRVVRAGSRRRLDSTGKSWSRQALVVAQVGAVTILLVAATLMVRSFQQVVSVDPGVRTRNVLAVSIELARDRYFQPHEWSSFFQTLIDQVSEIPGVQSVGATTGLPTRGVSAIDSKFRVEERPEPLPLETAGDSVSPGYFHAAGIPIRSGRPFHQSDGPNATPVAILNRKLAEAAFPGRDPVGKRVLASDDETWLTVVGVTGNVKQYGVDRETPPQMYRPLAQHPGAQAHLLVAADRKYPELAGRVKQVLQGLDPEQPVRAVQWMEDVLSGSIAARRFPALLLGGFGLVSLLLALAGIYGMLAHMVSLRTHEMGVRLAVGARKSDLLALILGPALRWTLAGLAAGLAGALPAVRYLESQLFGVRPFDPVSFALVAVSMPLASLLAGYFPARRAAATDPVRALRQD